MNDKLHHNESVENTSAESSLKTVSAEKSATDFFDIQQNQSVSEEDISSEYDVKLPPQQIMPENVEQTTINGEQEDLSPARLPAEAKRALVSLMRMGSIMASQKPKLFEQICRYQKNIQQHLADMYLRLLLDEKTGVALILQQEITGDGDEDDDTYTLISRRTLSLNDTLLLLVLRKFYQERESSGEQRIIVDVDRIETYLTPFLPLTNNSRSDRRSLNASLKKMTERKILSPVRSEDGRYEITPVIRYVVNAEFLERLLFEYKKLAEEDGENGNITIETETDDGVYNDD